MGMLKEFKEFAMKGSVVDLAVGVIIGTAFGAIVKSLVEDIIMPAIGLLGSFNFDNLVFKIDSAVVGHPGFQAEIRYGKFLTQTVQFLLVAFVLFLVIRTINRLKVLQTLAPTPPGPSAQEKLLMEIRDLLKARG
jgi:large conductance mechanosensitive channel